MLGGGPDNNGVANGLDLQQTVASAKVWMPFQPLSNRRHRWTDLHFHDCSAFMWSACSISRRQNPRVEPQLPCQR